MSGTSNCEQRLTVVLDTEFGEKLRDIWSGTPVWIVMSEPNVPAIKSLWATRSEIDHLTGITGFDLDPDMSPEINFLAKLDDIDLHHGSYSTNEPYTSIRVIGAKLTNEIRLALTNLGFSEFVELDNEFVAVRTPEEAFLDRANRTGEDSRIVARGEKKDG